MSDIDNERAAFDARLTALRRGRDGDNASSNRGEPGPPPLTADVMAEAAAFDAWLELRIAESRVQAIDHNQSSARSEAQFLKPVSTKIASLDPVSPIGDWLQAVDSAMLNDFDLGRFPLPAGLAAPTRWCETLTDFWQSVSPLFGLTLAADGGLAPPAAADLIQVGALHVPGRGCLVNAAHFYRDHQTSRQADVLGQPASRMHLLQEVVQAKWGLGFIAEYTALGQSMVAAGLWPVMLAMKLGVQSPSLAARADRLAAVRQGWLLTGAGWSEWVWEYLAHRARHPVGAQIASRPRLGRALELLHRLTNVFPLIVDVVGVRVRLIGIVDLFRYLFLEQTEIAPRTVHGVLRALSSFCAEYGDRVETTAGLRLETLAGWLYFSKIEASLGTFCVPYALLIACHQTCGLPEKQAGEIRALIESDPRAHVDTRLAMLAGLDSDARYNPRALFIAAWERLKLDGPKAYFDI